MSLRIIKKTAAKREKTHSHKSEVQHGRLPSLVLEMILITVPKVCETLEKLDWG